GALHDLHQVSGSRVRVLEQMDRRVDDLAQVVRRDDRRHAHCDPAYAVGQHVGEPGRQHDRLAVLTVVGRDPVDGLLVDLPDQLDVAQALLYPFVGHPRGFLSSSIRPDSQASMKRTSLAFSWMKFLRDSTSSPIRVEKISSAMAASSTPTRNSVRVAGSIVVS